jgi:hypothetical protein
MTENDVERFRNEAKECRQLAERATNPIDKQAWLRLAEDWIKLAEEAEMRHLVLPCPLIQQAAGFQHSG